MKCIFCGKEIIGFGNNAQPLKKGICCENCNITKVIPYRIKLYQEKDDGSKNPKQSAS